MDKNYPRTIQIFLPSGDPTSIRIAEQTTSIMRVIEVPRRDLPAFLAMEDAKQVALYFLIAGENKERVYIGQSNDIGARLLRHHQDPRTEYEDWERALVLVSLTRNLTQTHVLYLEALSLEKAKSCERYQVVNANNGQKTHITAPMKADCDQIHDITALLLATLGYPIFEPLLTEHNEQQTIFCCTRGGVDAQGIYTNDGMVVLKGSSMPYAVKRKMDIKSVEKRDHFLLKGILRREGDRCIFQQNYLFQTPSGASSFLLLGSSNGWVDWKTKQGITLSQHQGRE
ncbi:GIY-YIG nuclease family protein [Pasteurellaceae bacterium HPA106]|uniref:GIY-YIG nuclease family protein n=1 Tax=Spirabiliibacterium pneumoniae TaxID=221400 RepID=UPI001AAC93FE|nr:GIY-YIG nuclease family protein [Spirabiliibacterium pneumoniae]MBE2895947.1 GIY-YIG nuclease family protein [Spirabiliibacterium pneumoniae]